MGASATISLGCTMEMKPLTKPPTKRQKLRFTLACAVNSPNAILHWSRWDWRTGALCYQNSLEHFHNRLQQNTNQTFSSYPLSRSKLLHVLFFRISPCGDEVRFHNVYR